MTGLSPSADMRDKVNAQGSLHRPALTIALPTHNRAALLDQQLAWLARAISGLEVDCEVLVSDNCSTDDTPAVIERWCARMDLPGLRVQRHPRNLGAVRNIAWCIRAASGRHVWTISDDDIIDEDALRFVVKMILDDPALALLLLNFSSSMADTGRRLFDRCFAVADDVFVPRGDALFTELFMPRYDSRWGGLALTTALVYRTDLARAALDDWPDGLDNLMVQLYVTAFCAQRGGTMVTARPYLESIGGRAHFSVNPATYFRMRAADIPDVLVRLAAMGYSWRLCMWKLVERPGSFIQTLPMLVRTDPSAVARVLGHYGLALARMLLVGVRRLRLTAAPGRGVRSEAAH